MAGAEVLWAEWNGTGWISSGARIFFATALIFAPQTTGRTWSGEISWWTRDGKNSEEWRVERRGR